jgi:predicted site-specific integrase-resolvase
MSTGIIDLQKLSAVLAEDKLIPLKDAIARLGGVSIWTAYNWVERGKLQTVKLNNRHFVRESEINRIVREGL